MPLGGGGEAGFSTLVKTPLKIQNEIIFSLIFPLQLDSIDVLQPQIPLPDQVSFCWCFAVFK